MLKATELVLMLMSMFTSVTKENRQAVAFLCEAILGYDLATGQFGTQVESLREVHRIFEPLVALALYHGATYRIESMNVVSNMNAMLHTILDPILEQLSGAELDKIRCDMVEAIELTLFKPLCEVQDLTKQWILKAREDGSFDKYLLIPPVVQDFAGESSIKLGRLAIPIPGVDHGIGEASSSTLLDNRKMEPILTCCSASNFATVPCKPALYRCKRVEERRPQRDTLLVDHAQVSEETPTLSNRKPVHANPSIINNTNALGLELPPNMNNHLQQSPAGSAVATVYDPWTKQEPIESDTLIIRAEVERCMDFKFPTYFRGSTISEDELAPPTPGLTYESAGTTPNLTPLSTPTLSPVDLFDGWATAWEVEQLSTWSTALKIGKMNNGEQPYYMRPGQTRGSQSDQMAKWRSGLKAAEEKELRLAATEELFAGFAKDWETEQLTMWSTALKHGADEEEMELRKLKMSAVNAEWIDGWQKRKLDLWSVALKLQSNQGPQFKPTKSVNPIIPTTLTERPSLTESVELAELRQRSLGIEIAKKIRCLFGLAF